MKQRLISIILRAVLLFLLGSQSALAVLPLPDGFKKVLTEQDLGEVVGVGTFKTVRRVKGHDNYVVTYFTDSTEPDQRKSLKEEVDFLDDLRTKGIRTVETYGMVTVKGQPGYVMRYIPDAEIIRYQLGWSHTKGYVTALNRFNQNTLDDINLLYRALNKDQTLEIGDLQFLLAKDGHLYLNDPQHRHSRLENFESIAHMTSLIFEKLYNKALPFPTAKNRFLKMDEYKKIAIGSGTEKSVYEIEGDSNYVIAISYSLDPAKSSIAHFQQVLDLLDEIKSHGIVTVQHYGLVGVETLGRIKPGMVMENIKNSILVSDSNSFKYNTQAQGRLNENTLRDLQKVEQVMHDNPDFVIVDQQFLLKRDGHLVVIDPRAVENLSFTRAFRKMAQQHIDNIRRIAQEQIMIRDTVKISKKIIFTWIGGKPKFYKGDRITPAIWADLDANIPVELYYDPENMYAGLLKRMIRKVALENVAPDTAAKIEVNDILSQETKFEMQFVDYVKEHGLTDEVRLQFMKKVLGIPPSEADREAEAIRRYWEQDFVQENPKVILCNIQDLFVSQDTRVQQLKGVYERALTYKGGDLTSASDIVKVLALKKEGGLFVDHDMFPKGEEILQGLFDFINNNPDKVYLFKPRGLKIAEYAFEIKNIIATSQNSNFINHII
ncbi:MAG: hypothetical protein LGB78_09360, partial [Sulfurovum sp.]|nr:hypothetical protein [Sulfurovum sp.]